MAQNFPKRSVRKIKDSVRKTEALSKQVNQIARNPANIVHGLLTADLDAPADFGDDSTEGTLQLWVKNNTGTRKLIQSNPIVEITFRNYDPGLTRSEGTYFILQYDGEWNVIYCGCDGETYEDKL
jgi:hypothetical protein